MDNNEYENNEELSLGNDLSNGLDNATKNFASKSGKKILSKLARKKVEEGARKKLIITLISSPVFMVFLATVCLLSLCFLLVMVELLEKAGYSSNSEGFGTAYARNINGYNFYNIAKQNQIDYNSNNYLGKNEFIIEQKMAVLNEVYIEKTDGYGLATSWIRAAIQAGFVPGSYNDYYNFDDDEEGQRYNDFDDCVDLYEGFANYTEEERGVRMFVNMNVNDNCTYNLDRFFSKDFTERYGDKNNAIKPGEEEISTIEVSSTVNHNPALGTSKDSYQDTEADGTPIPDLYVEVDDTLRGLVNQMVLKKYSCIFTDRYVVDGQVVETIRTFNSTESGALAYGDDSFYFGQQMILFPTEQNMFQVGYLGGACDYFSTIVPLSPGANNREVSFTSSYYIDMDNYKNYLLESDFFVDRVPYYFESLDEKYFPSMKEKLFEEVDLFSDVYDLYDDDEYHTDGGGLVPGSGAGSFDPNNPIFSSNNTIYPLDNVVITSCFNTNRDINGEVNIHTGLDFSGGIGTALYASWSGKVIYSLDTFPNHPIGVAGTSLDVNNVNIIKILLDPFYDEKGDYYENVIMSYVHINTGSAAPVGTIVPAGLKVAEIGHNGWSTGAHLHMELYRCPNNATSCSYGRIYLDPYYALGLHQIGYCD